jgi:hypothetical protein
LLSAAKETVPGPEVEAEYPA